MKFESHAEAPLMWASGAWHRLQIGACVAIAMFVTACAGPMALSVPDEAAQRTAQAAAAAPTNAPAASEAASAVAAAAAAAAEQTSAAASAPLPASPAASAVEAPVDPLRPEVTVDLSDRTAQIDLWQRVRNGFGIADLDDDFVRRREAYYARQPDYVQRMAERGGRYLFHIVEEVQKRGLPSELALLPFIESAFNPQAMSSARASGMWQFMPATGRDFALRQNVFRDDRRDVLASTRAALDYLTRLHGMFGDWHLALAAYNWGEGSVQRAIKRNQNAGRPTDYASLSMPAETRDYVPKLQAMKNIVANPKNFGLSLPPLQNHPYFLGVPIARDIDVALAARLARLSTADFQALNPQMNKPVILAAGTPQVLLPYDNAAIFVQALAGHHGPLASWTAWVAPRTMKTTQAAQQVGMSDDELRNINNIPPRMLVKAGSTLLVPRSAQRQADVPEQLAHHAVMSLAADAPPSRRMVVRAGRKGETVAAIAKRHGVSAAQVAQWNKVTAASRFAGGSAVELHLPVRSTRAAAVSHSAKAERSITRAVPTAKGRAPPRAVAQRSAKGGLRVAEAVVSTKKR